MRRNAIRALGATLFLTLVSLLILPAGSAGSDWPSWRGDGSGVSDAANPPVEWDQEKNVVWKTKIAGEGFSSPIVSGDQVFLTTARPGSARHPSWIFASALAWLFVLAALWSALGGTPADPLATAQSAPAGRKALLVAVFLAVAVPLAMQSAGLVRTAIAGAVATLVTFVVSSALGRKDPARSADGWFIRLQSMGVLFLIGMFLTFVISKLLVKERFAYGETWATTAEMVTVGLLAMVGWVDRRSRSRLLMGVAALVVFFLLARLSPPSAAWFRNRGFEVFAAALGAGAFWFMAQHIVRRFRGDGPPVGAGLRGALSLAALAGIFFFMMNFLNTRSVLLREVVSVNRTTGELEWHTTVSDDKGPPSIHKASSAAAPTAVTDGELVYAHFAGAGIFALDYDGNVVWQREESAPPPHWGSGSSPILYDDLLIMTYDVDDVSFTEALDKRTGEPRWKADRTDQIETPEEGHFTLDAYSTPILFEWEGRNELVTHAKTILAAYDPETGSEIWRHKSKGRQVIPTTLQWNDIMIVGGAESQKYLAGIRVDANGEQEILWEAKRYEPEMSSPVLYNDLLFSVSGSGIAACRDPLTGEVIWRERMPGSYYSSLVAADGKIYFSNQDGVTSVVAAEREFKLLGRNEIGEPINATPAIVDGDLYLRTAHHLYRISGPDVPAPPMPEAEPTETAQDVAATAG